MTSDITPVVLTFDEAPNLKRTLARLSWAKEVVVLDSFSTDGTLAVAREFPNVRFVLRRFDTHVAQWASGIAECRTDWVLSLDADYVLSPELVEELKAWRPQPDVDAYFCRFQYCINGKPLRGSLYPPRAVLFQSARCRYVQDGHTQLLHVPGRVGWLQHVILHDDRKPLGRWLADQDRYARMEAEKLSSAAPQALSWPDRLRRHIVMAPPLVFLGTLLGKGLIFDGWRGWFYACQRTISELLLSLRLAQARLQRRE